MIETKILIGLMAVLIAFSTVVYVGINEPDRRAEFEQAFHGRSVEAGAALFTQYCTECHNINGQGYPGVAPALNSKHLFENRLDEISYQGTLESYLKLTIAGGRPVKSGENWARKMPTWSVDYGGPLRNDQIDNIVDYILNWEQEAPDLGALAAQPVAGDTPEERGANLFQSLGCVACHTINGQGGAVGPELTNVYADKGEDYVRQSILEPNADIVEGFQPDIMPQDFGQRLSDENLNDLISYLKSVSGN
jgi:cbb3-type cytochrome c oxidase subunit III